MADGGTTKETTTHRSLTLAEVDRVNECAYKALGIVTLIRLVSAERHNLPDDALPGACWAAESLIEEMTRIATGEKRHG